MFESDCCEGQTGPWSQNLRRGSACKTDMSGHHVSVGQDSIRLINKRQAHKTGQKDIFKNALAKFTSLLNVSKLE